MTICRIVLVIMKIKQTVNMVVIGMVAVLGLFATTLIAPSLASAACDPATQSCCGGVETSILTCDQAGGESDDIRVSGVWGILLLAINILTAGIGIAALGGLIYGSVLYTTAAGSAEQVKKARTIFVNIVIGIIAYALMYSLLNFLIPGGVF